MSVLREKTMKMDLTNGTGILQVWPDLMQDIGAIEKSQYNSYEKFQFRGIEDTMAVCQPVFIKHKVAAVPSVEECLYNETISYTLNVRFIAQDGSWLEASTFVGGGSSAKAGGKKAFQMAGQAYSYAWKELIWKTFVSPVKQEDPDRDENDTTPAPQKAPQKASKGSTKPKQVKEAIKLPELEDVKAMSYSEVTDVYREFQHTAPEWFISAVIEIGLEKAPPQQDDADDHNE